MKIRSYRYFLLNLVLMALLAPLAEGQEEARGVQLGITQFIPSEEFLYRSGTSYDNRAFEDWLYPDIYRRGPYQNFYGPLGDYVFKGFDAFSWHETRTTANRGEVEGSNLVKVRANYGGIFDANLVASEMHQNWAAKLLMANEIPTGLTPLTMSKAGFNGVRLDIQTQSLNLSFLGQRPSNPVTRVMEGVPIEAEFPKRDSDLLFGAHGEVNVGALTLGATGINYHVFDSRQPFFELKGQLSSKQPMPEWVVVRFADDSPEDKQGGAVVSDIRILVNGEPRPDLEPFFVRINTRNPTAVGRTSSLTKVFQPTNYPDQGTRFADVFYMMDHLEGDNVSRKASVERLERFVEVLPTGSFKRADGNYVVMAYYDLREEPYVRSVGIEALVGNDYAIDVRQYPDGRPEMRLSRDWNAIRNWEGLRSDSADEAYYLTGHWRRGQLEVGGEIFSIGPNYADEILMEDNDDRDRFPDGIVRSSEIVGGTSLGDPGADPDGVFPGKDKDNDGVPDTNRNGNKIPDYDEAFLLFDVEPDEYVYGRDWNHNGVVDYRENDYRLDYPYTPDQRGYHLFGRWHLPGGLALGFGQQQARGIAFGGHNNSTYSYLTFEAERAYFGRLFGEVLVQEVKDDIEDPYETFDEFMQSAEAAGRGFAPQGGMYYKPTKIKN